MASLVRLTGHKGERLFEVMHFALRCPVRVNVRIPVCKHCGSRVVSSGKRL